MSCSDQYRVYRGDGGVDSCLAEVFTSTTTGPALPETPAAGWFFWYVVAAENGDGEGTSGSATPGPRTLNSSGPCRTGCTPDGGDCASSAKCCSYNCAGGACQSLSTTDGAFCSTPDQCCSGLCTAAGGACTSSGQCCSSICSGGTCLACIPTGGACGFGVHCCTGGCDYGTCQAGPCNPAGGACSTGADCCSGACQYGSCQ